MTQKTAQLDDGLGVSASPRVVESGPIPKGGGRYQLGGPYKVAGRWYKPKEDPDFDRSGLASWYGSDFHGRRTANGEVYDVGSITAASPTLPLPSYVRVTNLQNHRSLLVRVNDRGPYHSNRLIDVSERAADLLAFKGAGTASVRVQFVKKAPLEGNDEKFLMASLQTDTGTPAKAPAVMLASVEPHKPVPAARSESRQMVAQADIGADADSSAEQPLAYASTSRLPASRPVLVKPHDSSSAQRATVAVAHGSRPGKSPAPVRLASLQGMTGSAPVEQATFQRPLDVSKSEAPVSKVESPVQASAGAERNETEANDRVAAAFGSFD
ncbi:septal ring lytic transglycosylase RlpA family protein [Faunimonas pinastri]|uniref:septal ring lytic transglycosylase RlpA family protein n=1 Tax=Faunimonas pinastri TaxID=1855383 RepID=UPI001EEBFB2A|nr:septal ring lytic transglycosylase RlpA family protein [Faunimonas pinastri]